MYEQAVAKEKRYLCGPKILAELTGSARRLVAGKGASWISYNGGVGELLRHLRACLGKPQISELSEFLNKYFKHSRRRPQETINDYVTRKCEVYLRAQQALRRVAPHHGPPRPEAAARPESSTSWTPWWSGSRRSSLDSSDYGNTEARPEVWSAAPTAADTHGAEAAEEQEREDDPSGSWDNNQSHYWGNHWSYYHQTRGYWGNSSYEPWWSSSSSWRQQDAYDRKADQGGSMPELLPDYVQGWYLLQDAGLTTHERNVVQTALQGDFSLQRVAQELRNQWSGADLLKRESGHRQSGYLGEHMDYEPDDNDEEDPDHLENYEALDPESRAEWDAQEDEAQSAMAAMYQAKRTLREARARQHDVRLSRQYYRGGRGNGRGRGASHGNKDDSGMTCLRCGRQGHRVANCPQPPTSQSAQATTGPEATSSFICYSDHQAPGAGDQALGVTTTSDAVHQGKAVLDGGATRTLASIEAMEAIMRINQDKSCFRSIWVGFRCIWV